MRGHSMTMMHRQARPVLLLMMFADFVCECGALVRCENLGRVVDRTNQAPGCLVHGFDLFGTQ